MMLLVSAVQPCDVSFSGFAEDVTQCTVVMGGL